MRHKPTPESVLNDTGSLKKMNDTIIKMIADPPIPIRGAAAKLQPLRYMSKYPSSIPTIAMPTKAAAHENSSAEKIASLGINNLAAIMVKTSADT